jgi:hypothetical protein
MSHSSDQIPCFNALVDFVAGDVAGLLSPRYAFADKQAPLNMVLDGKTFQSRLGLKGQPFDVDDFLVFEDGQFVSQECARKPRAPIRVL